MTIKPKELIKELKRHGFIEIRSNGSHRFLKHPESGEQPLFLITQGNYQKV